MANSSPLLAGQYEQWSGGGVPSGPPSAPTISNATASLNKVTLTGTAPSGNTIDVFDQSGLLGTTTVNGSGAWSLTTAALTPGAYTFTARDTDNLGNTSAVSNSVNEFVGSSGPPIISSFSPDSGVAGDNITNATVLTLTGAAPANGTVTVYQGATKLGTTLANSSGVWSYATPTLANGTYAFTATDTVAGTTSSASSPFSVTISTSSSCPGDHRRRGQCQRRHPDRHRRGKQHGPGGNSDGV